MALRNCFRQAYNGGAPQRRDVLARHRAQRQGRAEHVARLAGQVTGVSMTPSDLSPRLARDAARLLVVVVFLALAGTARADTLKVGTLTLRSCGERVLRGALAAAGPGAADRAADRHRVPLVPRRRRRRPGRRSSPSRAGLGIRRPGTRVEYRGIFGPLVRQRGMLLVDNRGTGGSALIDCKSVQSFTGRTSGSAFARRAGRCGKFIERAFGRGASALFSHRLRRRRPRGGAARAAVRTRSTSTATPTATFFVQDFVARHPRRAATGSCSTRAIRAAAPTPGTRPRARRSGSRWRQVSPGSVARLGELLDRVRAAPITGRDQGRRRRARCRCASTRARSPTSCRPRPRTR